MADRLRPAMTHHHRDGCQENARAEKIPRSERSTVLRSDCKKEVSSPSAPSALPRESRNALLYACVRTSTKARRMRLARRSSRKITGCRGHPACQPLSSTNAIIPNMIASSTPTNAPNSPHWPPHQYALAIRSHLHSRSPDQPTLPTLSCTPIPSNGRDGGVGKCQQKFPDRSFLLQNTVCLVHLKQSMGLPATMRREYIVGSVGNHKWRSSTFLEVTISGCRCWSRAL